MRTGVVIVVPLGLTVAGLPVAVWFAGRWAFLAQTIELEDASVRAALRTSSELVRGRWLRVASLTVTGAAIGLLLGPFVGALLIFVTDAPFALLNIVAGIVYALAMPLVALTTTYVYLDAVVNGRLAPRALEQLPSGISEPGTAGATAAGRESGIPDR